MEKHITVIAVLYIVLSALGILASTVVFLILAGAGLLSGDTEAIAITSTIGSVIFFFVFLLSIPGIIGGIGLLKRREWGRILVLILGFLNLLNIPFGTALGIYTIWALMNDELIGMFQPPEPGLAGRSAPTTHQ
jgi:hypothetical protein